MLVALVVVLGGCTRTTDSAQAEAEEIAANDSLSLYHYDDMTSYRDTAAVPYETNECSVNQEATTRAEVLKEESEMVQGEEKTERAEEIKGDSTEIGETEIVERAEEETLVVGDEEEERDTVQAAEDSRYNDISLLRDNDTIAAAVDTPQPFMAVRTNLLYDAVLVPNVGVEVWLGKGFTLGADWFGTWLSSDKNHWYWQGYGGYLTARYYWGKAANEMRFTGHHVGIYGTALTYDVEFGGRGYQATKFGFGGGVEYGYSLRVARSLSLDFNLGLGYQGGEYKTYLPTDDGTGHYVWESTRLRHWWGPTKAEVSLKWMIGPVEKGGGR